MRSSINDVRYLGCVFSQIYKTFCDQLDKICKTLETDQKHGFQFCKHSGKKQALEKKDLEIEIFEMSEKC